MKAFLRAVRDVGLLIARVVVGGVLMMHGWHRWQGTGIPAQVAVLQSAGVGNPELVAWAVTAFELVGGGLLVFGLATPLVGLGMIVQNLAVAWLVDRPHGFYLHQGGWEYHVVLAVVGLLLLTHGSGRLGLDALFLRPSDDDATGVLPDPGDRDD